MQPQSWVTANEGFIVIHVTDASKGNAVAGYPVLIRRRKDDNEKDTITDQMVLEALAVSTDPIHAIQRDELITLGDDKC